jgi:hydroxypyruvate isomerase
MGRKVGMRYSVCLPAVFKGMDPIEGMRRVKKLGFDAVEFWSWWDVDLDAVLRTRQELGMTITAFCTKFVSMTDKSKRQLYLDGLKESIEAAKKCGVKMLITQVGNDTGKSWEQQTRNVLEGLKTAVPILEDAGITLLVEPLNIKVDHKGYFLSLSSDGFDLIRNVESPRVKLLYDIYHQQITEGNLIPTIVKNIGDIGHFHAAGHPGRHELDAGEINYPNVFRAIREAGYQGYVGLEYFPVREPEEGLRALIADGKE